MSEINKNREVDGTARVRGKSVYIKTLGCQMNVRDSEVICGLLRSMSYELTANPEEADVVIFNTCSVRQQAEDKVWSQIGIITKLGERAQRKMGTVFAKGQAKGQSPSGTVPLIGIVGCMAQNYKEKIFERSPDVDFVVGPADIGKIPEIIEKLRGKRENRDSPQKAGTVPIFSAPFFEAKIWETDSVLRPEEIYHAGYYKDNGHAYVVISEGCSNFCSYCVVPYVRGALRNRESQDILEEIKQALAQGISSVTLLGQNVNAYQNNGINFVKLVELVNSLQGLKDFSFITSHPKDTTEELFIAMRDCQKLTKHLHLPLQSGSDKILRLMNRGYSRKYYLDLIAKYRKIVKGGKLSSDIIVGFPGENEDDFANTRDLVLNARFNSAYIFKYSPRPNTAAEKLPDDVPRAEKERRHSIILELQKKISHKFKA